MKKSVIVVGLMSALLLAGCSSNNSSSSNSNGNSSISKSESSTAYQKLSSNDKKNVEFKVTKDGSDGDDEDSDFDLSMKITNKTKKTIKFDKSKFNLLINGEKKASSDEKGTLVIKPGEHSTIKEIFEDVSGSILKSSGLTIQYLNGNNVVATPDLSSGIKAGSSDYDDDVDDDDTDDQTSNVSSNSSDDDSGQVVKRADQAEDLYRRVNGDWGAGIAVTQTSGGWQITQDGDDAGFVSNSGDVQSIQNGGQVVNTSYDEILHMQQNGGPVKP